MQNNDNTTVRISKKTKHLLDEVGKEIGSFGDTYDDVIVKLINSYKNRHKIRKNRNGENQ